jgi:methyltransferase (TIGR00027 family)
MPNLMGVAATSLPAAANRMAESARPDRWFDDPLAAAFVAASQWRPPEDDEAGEIWVVVRTRFFDEYLAAASASGCRQVVLVGAGLDARAFRLCWPLPASLFEIDQPQTFAFKESVIASVRPRATCRRSVVPADLREDWTPALRAHGFDPLVRTVWLIEGVLTYLSHEEVNRLMQAVSQLSAPGSRLGLTAATRATTAGALRAGWAIDGTPEAWLAPFGWDAVVVDVPECADRYGRSMHGERVIGTLLTADR